MKTKFYTLILLLSCSFAGKAQDINFSQFYELPLLRNPALAGIYRGDIRITTAYRNQWASVTTPYNTQAIGAEVKMGISEYSDDYLSLGVQITNDLAGDSKMGRTQILPVVAFHKSMSAESDAYLTFGFMGGFVQQRFDPSGLTFDDQFVNGSYSPTNPTHQTFNNTNITYFDAAAGVRFSSTVGMGTKFYIGGAYFHFNQPKVAFSPTNDIRLNKKYVVNAGVSLPTSETDRVTFYLDYFMQGGHRQGQGGFMFKHDIFQEDEDFTFSLSGGGMLRWNDAIIPVVKLDYYGWAVGLTYDVNISKLKPASHLRGAYELTLSYSSFLNINNSSASKVKCPVPF